jgi:tRNA dimethylallyltransferase
MEPYPCDLVTVLGHTAAGKTAFAANLANELGGEIISADSRQVYREMDIGTGKDYEDYLVNGRQVPVHLIDIMEAGYEYNVYLFKQDFLRVYAEITDRNLLPILCGGSGLYIESVLRNYKLLDVPINEALRKDLEKKSYKELVDILRLYGPLHNVTDTVNKKRTIRAIEIGMFQSSQPETPDREKTLNPIVFGIRYDRNIRRKRITERLQQRLEEGMITEVEELMKKGISEDKLEYYGLEYRYISRYLMQKLTYDEMFRELNTAIHQFAKRQMTYFRGMERRGISIHWIDGQLSMQDKVKEVLLKLPGKIQDKPDQSN